MRKEICRLFLAGVVGASGCDLVTVDKPVGRKVDRVVPTNPPKEHYGDEGLIHQTPEEAIGGGGWTIIGGPGGTKVIPPKEATPSPAPSATPSPTP